MIALFALLTAQAVPGALNGAVTQATIDQTICVRGWSASVRPSWSYTNALKYRLVRAAHGRMSDYELDHAIPLSLGGSPADPRNLWLERWDGPWGAHAKDRVEDLLHRRVCAHQMTLDAARRAVWPHWRATYVAAFGRN